MSAFELSEEKFKALCNRELEYDELKAIMAELEKIHPREPRSEARLTREERLSWKNSDEYKQYLHKLAEFQTSENGQMYPTIYNVLNEYYLRDLLAKTLVRYSNTIDYEGIKNDFISDVAAEDFAALNSLKKLACSIAADTYNVIFTNQYLPELSLDTNIFPVLSQAFVIARSHAQGIEEDGLLIESLCQRTLQLSDEPDVSGDCYYAGETFHYVFEDWFNDELMPEVLTALFKLAQFDKSGITFPSRHARQLAHNKIFQWRSIKFRDIVEKEKEMILVTFPRLRLWV